MDGRMAISLSTRFEHKTHLMGILERSGVRPTPPL
jgi:hypothetical protein